MRRAGEEGSAQRAKARVCERRTGGGGLAPEARPAGSRKTQDPVSVGKERRSTEKACGPGGPGGV